MRIAAVGDLHCRADTRRNIAVALRGVDQEADVLLLAGDLQRFARAAGLDAVAFHGTLDDVVYELAHGRPVLVGVADPTGARERPHYEVVVGWDPAARRLRNLDPARGFIERTFSGFESEWQLAKQLTLVVFAAEPPATLDASTKIADDLPPRSPTKS